ncbi:helix-turn-helix domain-containing protein [Streptomyces sp. NBC_01456]|uniref:helix-turn-helix domain-containing protein n=1 Tax=unclassified Streptomyces TaxID=2593676 RepID=UPI002E336D69|nr:MULTISPECIES: helix-turn-helix transcriptional regulator [unclassified Streptomyces]
MAQWSDYTTGERIKILRGKERQTDLAERTGLSVVMVQKAEQDRALSLPTLMKIADALNTDTSVVLGQQELRRSMEGQDRAMMRALSRVVHDTAAGLVTADEESTLQELEKVTGLCWGLCWKGHYTEAGSLVAPLVASAAALVHAAPVGAQAPALGVLSDAYRIAGYVANLTGARDLAYAAIGHAQAVAERACDDLRGALVASGRTWAHLRDARLPEALSLAEKAAVDIEPRYSAATPEQLTVYGSHVNFAAVVASRMEDKGRAADYLSQSHAAGARMSCEYRAHGTLFGPVTATTQAVGISVALGHAGKALALADSIRDVSALTAAARNRYAMDKALAQADAKMWDASLDTLDGVLRDAPEWGRHQALPGVIVQKVGKASMARLRRVSELIGVRSGAESFAPATARTAL